MKEKERNGLFHQQSAIMHVVELKIGFSLGPKIRNLQHAATDFFPLV